MADGDEVERECQRLPAREASHRLGPGPVAPLATSLPLPLNRWRPGPQDKFNGHDALIANELIEFYGISR
jgi:hypothetical protein